MIEKKHSWKSAEALFCKSCRERRIDKPNAENLLQMRAMNPIGDDSLEMKDPADLIEKEQGVSIRRINENDNYLKDYISLYEATGNSQEKEKIFFRRFSRVIIEDLELGIPTYYWMEKAMENNENADQLLFVYRRLLHSKLLSASGESVVLNDKKIMDLISPYFDLAVALKKAQQENEKLLYEEAYSSENTSNGNSSSLSSLDLMFRDLRTYPYMRDEDYYWNLQQIEKKRAKGEDYVDHVNALVMANMFRVVKQAYIFSGAIQGNAINEELVLDLIQEGSLGLHYAFAKKCDWRRNYAQSTYIIWFIKDRMIDYMRKDKYSSGAYVPEQARQDYVFYKRFVMEFCQKFQRFPTRKESEDGLRRLKGKNYDVDRVFESLLNAIKPVIYLYSPVRSELDNTELVDVIPDDDAGDFERIEKRELKNLIGQLLSEISSPEDRKNFKILLEYVGYYTGEESTLENIGKIRGQSKERMRQRKGKAIAYAQDKWSTPLSDYLPSS